MWSFTSTLTLITLLLSSSSIVGIYPPWNTSQILFAPNPFFHHAYFNKCYQLFRTSLLKWLHVSYLDCFSACMMSNLQHKIKDETRKHLFILKYLPPGHFFHQWSLAEHVISPVSYCTQKMPLVRQLQKGISHWLMTEFALFAHSLRDWNLIVG